MTEKIFKLSYTDKATAVADLKAKEILVESTFQEETFLIYGEGVAAVVEIGLIMLTPPTFDEEGNELTPAVYVDGYHYDVMSDNEYNFGTNLVEPKNPKHAFAGHAITEEYPLIGEEFEENQNL
jgi:hypothetical protein